MFKVKNLVKSCEICSKLTVITLERRQWRLTIKTFEQSQWCLSGLIVNFKHILHHFLFFIVYFEQVNVCWVMRTNSMKKNINSSKTRSYQLDLTLPPTPSTETEKQQQQQQKCFISWKCIVFMATWTVSHRFKPFLYPLIKSKNRISEYWLEIVWFYNINALPVNIYLFKVNSRNTRRRSEICSKLTIKTPEWRQWRLSGVFC